MTSRILKHLRHEVCPTCGSGIQSETFTGRTHCNGQQFENITFQCGSNIEWIPNFERESVARICPASAVAVARDVRRKAVSEAILKAVEPLGLTDGEREKITRFLRYDW